MTPPPYTPNRMIGNVAALVLLILGAAYLFDRAARWLGYSPAVLCSTVSFLTPIAFALGVVLATLGTLIWAMSRFRHGGAISMMIGGAMLSLLPPVMPHYFATTCIQ